MFSCFIVNQVKQASIQNTINKSQHHTLVKPNINLVQYTTTTKKDTCFPRECNHIHDNNLHKIQTLETYTHTSRSAKE